MLSLRPLVTFLYGNLNCLLTAQVGRTSSRTESPGLGREEPVPRFRGSAVQETRERELVSKLGFREEIATRGGLPCTALTLRRNSMMDLVTLPDDALLEVLAFLDTRELLECRRVCRRLRDAALHPDLWRMRRLSSFGWLEDEEKLCLLQLLAATLRLAPCLDRLTLCCHDIRLLPELESLLLSTSCAISELDVHVLGSSSAVSVAKAIARQAALGHLESVSLNVKLFGRREYIPDVQVLLDQLLTTRGLTSIALNMSDCVYHTRCEAVSASLRKLQYIGPMGPWVGPFCFLSKVLQWHADTLQVVHFSEAYPYPPAGTADLLGALPNLRELRSPFMDGMPALLQCPALRTLHLSLVSVDGVDEPTRPILLGVQHYLRQAVAGCLETLTLEYLSEDEPVGEDALNVVRSLAGPGSGAPSALRSLSLTYDEQGDVSEPQPQLAHLASVLPCLENLVSLDLGGPHTAELLEAMDGRVLPRLERLRVCVEGHRCGRRCPHEWAHGAEPRALLRRYPRLHLEVAPVHGSCHECYFSRRRSCQCGFCLAHGCHDFSTTAHVLFGHPENQLCNQEHSAVEFFVEL